MSRYDSVEDEVLTKPLTDAMLWTFQETEEVSLRWTVLPEGKDFRDLSNPGSLWAVLNNERQISTLLVCPCLYSLGGQIYKKAT